MRAAGRDQVSSALFFLLGLLICGFSLNYKIGSLAAPGSGLMPLVTGLAMCAFALVGFIDSTFKGRAAGQRQRLFEGQGWRKSLATLVALLGFQLLMTPIGFIPATVLFIGFLLRAIVPQRWPVVIVVSLTTAVLSYLVFDFWLQAQLPQGPWTF